MSGIFDLIIGVFRIIAGLSFLLFIPGFAISWVFYPRTPDIPFFERLVLSTILSIGAVIGVVIVMDIALGIETRAINILISLIIITFMALIVWKVECVLKKIQEKHRGQLNKVHFPGSLILKIKRAVDKHEKKLRTLIPESGEVLRQPSDNAIHSKNPGDRDAVNFQSYHDQ